MKRRSQSLRVSAVSRKRGKRGIGTVVGMMFFVLIAIIVITILMSIFSSFTSYVQVFTSYNQQAQQNEQTSISISSLNFAIPAPTLTGPSTVDTSTTKLANAYSGEQKLIYAQGLWWSFYSSGSTTTGIEYRTSSDGLTWSSATQVTSGTGTQYGYTFSVANSGTTIYYALSNPLSSSSFRWGYGTLNAGGTVTWSINGATVAISHTANNYISIVSDASGNVWVALASKQGSTYYIEVWERVGTTWSPVHSISGGLTSTSDAQLLTLTSGIGLIYGNGGTTTGTVYVITTPDGVSWSSPVSPASDYALLFSSAYSVGDVVYFAGMASASSGASTGTVNFWNFTYGGASTTAETAVESSTSGWYTSITRSTPTTFLIFYGSGSNMYYTYSTDQGATWSSRQIISTSENTLSGIASSNIGGGVVWTSGASSPYNVRFAALSAASNWQITSSFQNSSPFSVHLISFYLYDVNSSSLVSHWDTNSSAPGVAGTFDQWVAAGQVQSVTLTFNWTHRDSYLATVTTDQGIVVSSDFVAPA